MDGHIDIDGARIRYRFDGPEGAPVVTLSNSLASDLTMWDAQVAALAPRYRVLRYDRRGHGGSDAAGPYDWARFADDIRALWRAFGIARSHFVGLSMGGMDAQTLAIAREPVLDRIVIADSMSEVGAAYRAACDERIALARARGMDALVEPTLGRWFTAPFVAANPPALDNVRRMIRATSVEGYCACTALLKALNLTAGLPRIDRPTLIVVGADDPSTTVAAAALMHAQIRGSKLVVLPQAAHLANIEQAELFNRAVLEFLAG